MLAEVSLQGRLVTELYSNATTIFSLLMQIHLITQEPKVLEPETCQNYQGQQDATSLPLRTPPPQKRPPANQSILGASNKQVMDLTPPGIRGGQQTQPLFPKLPRQTHLGPPKTDDERSQRGHQVAGQQEQDQNLRVIQMLM
ncbi:hypothetical protein ACLOJK_011420 [Asimina triloba]